MGSAYERARFANFETTTPYQATVLGTVRAYSANFPEHRRRGEGCVLYGPSGGGKDHLSAATAMQAIVQHGMTVRFCKGLEWFGSIRDAIGEDRSEAAVLNPLKAPDLLVISDPLPPFGALTQHQASMLYRAVEHRASCGKPTMLTINVADDDEADQRLGVAVWDRLRQKSLMVHMAWASHRQPIQHLRPPANRPK